MILFVYIVYNYNYSTIGKMSKSALIDWTMSRELQAVYKKCFSWFRVSN